MMKLISVLTFLIFNSILWSLINSVKNNKNQNELNRVEEPSKDLNKIFNDGAESSVVPQVHEYKEKLNSETKMSNNETSADIYEEKKLKKKEYMKNYYQNNKSKKRVYDRNYNQNNKEKRLKLNEINKETKRKHNKEYYQKNKEKLDANRKANRKNKNNKGRKSGEGTSFANPQNKEWENKGREPIVSKENLQLEQGVIHEGGNSFNLQEDNCEDNSMNFHNVQENVHDGHRNQQNTDWNDFDTMNLLEDTKFLDYLNEILGSKSG